MMNDQHLNFLYSVKNYIEAHPEVGAYVSEFVASGIEESRRQALERAADMEVALSVAIAKRWSGREELILAKLNKWKDKASLRWDRTIEMLEEVKK